MLLVAHMDSLCDILVTFKKLNNLITRKGIYLQNKMKMMFYLWTSLNIINNQ